MTTHIFIVNDDTIPIHLKYLFAGTGAKDKDEDISLLADIKRVRPGDFVIFYIEGTTKIKGGFYGIFKIADQSPLVFHTLGANGLQPNLPKKLIYRVLIEPYEVYSEGVPEWEALDKLPIYATKIQWSLIYRKLKGKRGCTPLLPWEADRLIDMLRNKNSGKVLANSNFRGGFDWDKTNRKIAVTQQRNTYSYPKQPTSSLLPIICKLQKDGKAYEKHLQAFFMENIGTNKIPSSIVGNNIEWFGNEVACGVGMQKMDILIISSNNGEKKYRIIELKDEPVSEDVVDQISYYVKWGSQDFGRHLLGAYSWNIQPVIVAPHHSSRNWNKVVSAFKKYNKTKISLPILYFEFNVDCGRTIDFKKVDYEAQ